MFRRICLLAALLLAATAYPTTADEADLMVLVPGAQQAALLLHQEGDLVRHRDQAGGHPPVCVMHFAATFQQWNRLTASGR